MQRQKLKNLKILHTSKNRIRFFYKNLNEFSDVYSLENDILSIKGVKSVRINKIAKSIAIVYEKDFEDIFLEIEKLEIKKNSPKKLPSKFEIYNATFSLLLERFIKNKKFALNSSVISSIPLLKDGLKELVKNGLTSRVLEAMAVGISLLRKDLLAANSTNLMLSIGEFMEENAVYKSDDLIKELAKPTIKEAWIEIIEDKKRYLKKVLTKDIKVGDIVVVGIGQTIAIDGYIVEGSASVNQVSMTGEAKAVRKERGDRVMSGTIVEDGKIKIWAELIGSDTSTEKIKKYIQTSLNEKSEIGLKATKLADKLVPITLTLGVLSYFINKNTTALASVLQADYSCALKLATPVAFKTSISKAGKNGILIKGAKSIESLSKADTFVFDKTGTLTHGTLKVIDIISFDDKWEKDKILNLAASAEEHYFHPIAEAIVNAAREIGFKHIHHDEVEFIVAHGIKTHFDKKEVIIGSRHFLEDDEKVNFKKHENEIQKALKKGYTLLYIAYDKKLLGIIVMNDKIRKNAKDTILRLKELGAKEIIMLTGDIPSKAMSVAKELGIDRVFSNMLPTDKSLIIEKIKKEGKKVVFCGDGINDAPSIAKADIGISMQRGADITKASSDILLLKDDIYAIAQAKEISNATMKLIDANFNATVIINSAILLGATFNKLSPIATAFLHNGTTIGLLLNSMKGIRLSK